jgi:hypothetical protein
VTRSWRTTRAIRRTLAAVNPDVLVTHNWGSIEWVLANRSVGVSARACRGRLRTRGAVRPDPTPGADAPDGLAAEHGDPAVADADAHCARDAWKVAGGARLRHVPNAIDLGRFHPPVSASLRTAGPPRVGAVAAMRPEKNLGRSAAGREAAD